MLETLLVIAIVGAVIGFLAGRHAKWVGGGVILLGLGAIGYSYVHETYIEPVGDTSDVGMLCTILLVTCVPLGCVIVLAGALRR